MRSGRDPVTNTHDALALIGEAAGAGAALIATPEMTNLVERDPERLLASVVPEADDPSLRAFRNAAREHGRWLLIGSLALAGAVPGRAVNRSFLLAPDGTIAARYDKLHLFDVDLPGRESYRESATYDAGKEAVAVEAAGLSLGLSICYDLRFPALYRALAEDGAQVLTVPAAFTRRTGEAHWHVLLRARAIETGSFVLAPAQGGKHEDGRSTFGHSLIVSPWGEVLAEGGTEPGIVTAEIDPGAVEAARTSIPSLAHSRPFDGPR
jgi:predicted amidohydrolase